uniref:amino acid aminotransferase n=1 Tax=Vaginimicrobium propionicum TaxID=1871034 RepID=UPI000970BBF1|nr:amino acid aminotransferase [Vaginimicrobium propionicum]
MSLFSTIEQAPADAILGLTDAFKQDSNPKKVNLGVGVYQDEDGKLPLLKCVRLAEQELTSESRPRNYLPITGLPSYNQAVQRLVLGLDSQIVVDQRAVTVQGLGGTGGLKIAADFLKRVCGAKKALVSAPSWPNHRNVFATAGFEVDTYTYYDAKARGINFDQMIADLRSAQPGTVIILHACCHNPTGYDLDHNQWAEIIDVVSSKSLIPVIDMAYQGFSESLEEDGWVVRAFADKIDNFLVANSFSKSFSLYGERVGALTFICADADQAERVNSQVKIVIRTNYSNPPTHGAALVTKVLTNDRLYQLWVSELGDMRQRIKKMRAHLVEGLKSAGVEEDMSFITNQVGMFSFCGLNKDQMIRLRQDFSIYGTDSSRICMAGLNMSNIEYVSRSFAAILKP